ncbi:hypothetical protein GGS23DRAFT_598623 [Durotheca rogersii]|uniref:uncharacterized protein n=1 Tax=Durotheca rogersii TaxID=419775 RepID=UPI00221EE976|nr:uncharacterized protein GGS23DRAFT_598623 [Durotheca rogersii]KAI5861471.1 hypothetical protein GGS23DRAFT_598623 [Durotheca rogersii]
MGLEPEVCLLAGIRNEMKDTRIYSYWPIYVIYGQKPYCWLPQLCSFGPYHGSGGLLEGPHQPAKLAVIETVEDVDSVPGGQVAGAGPRECGVGGDNTARSNQSGPSPINVDASARSSLDQSSPARTGVKSRDGRKGTVIRPGSTHIGGGDGSGGGNGGEEEDEEYEDEEYEDEEYEDEEKEDSV